MNAADMQAVSEMITRMLTSYSRTDTAPKRSSVDYWLEQLSEFSAAHICKACTEWVRASSEKPTIADIRKRICGTQADCQRSGRRITGGRPGSQKSGDQNRKDRKGAKRILKHEAIWSTLDRGVGEGSGATA